MQQQAIIAGGIGVAIVAVLIGGGLFLTRHNKVELRGEIQKVRSQQINDTETVAVIDFRVTNPSTAQFQVKEVSVTLDTADGHSIEGGVFSELDAVRLFEYYKMLGAKYNPTLLTRDKIESNQTAQKMIAVKFTTSDQVVQNRKAIHIIVEDVDGQKTEIVENKRAS